MDAWCGYKGEGAFFLPNDCIGAAVIEMIFFPRVDDHRWSIPKYHGMSKMLFYIQLYDSGINVYGGPGESHDKYFVKASGSNTRRRVSNFAKQIANQVYESMILEIANEKVTEQDNEYGLVGFTLDEDNDFEHFSFFGNYKLSITDVNGDGESGVSTIKWNNEHKK